MGCTFPITFLFVVWVAFVLASVIVPAASIGRVVRLVLPFATAATAFFVLLFLEMIARRRARAKAPTFFFGP